MTCLSSSRTVSYLKLKEQNFHNISSKYKCTNSEIAKKPELKTDRSNLILMPNEPKMYYISPNYIMQILKFKRNFWFQNSSNF